MSFYEKLRTRLKGKLNEKEQDLLPRSYQLVGKILVIRLKPSLVKYKKTIGEAAIHLLPYAHTVCLEREIKGVTRKPRVEIIAGCNIHQPSSTQTLHKEHGCQFLLDVSEVMWSKGNKEERQRLIKHVKSGEVIVDMFCGVGYFSIFIAKYCNPRKIYCIDINPKALEYLRKNVWLNGVENKIEILEGDSRKFANLLEDAADRIIMGYLKKTEKFLPYAFKMLKKKGTIHFHNTVKIEEVEKVKQKLIRLGRENNRKITILGFKKVKSFAPKIWHGVFDLKVEKP